MLLGIGHLTIAHRGLTPIAVLELASQRRLDGVRFLEPASIDPDLDQRHLEQFRDLAERLGLYLEVGLPSPNPLRCLERGTAAADPKAHAKLLAPHLEAVATLGCRHACAFVGNRHDRFRRDPPWSAQLEATRQVLEHLRPLLKSFGLRIALETHADVTVTELLRLVEDVGTDIVGVTLDTGNLVMRLDDPLEAAERLAPLVLSVHAKDAVLAFSQRGLRWQVRPVGSGILPIPEILARVERATSGVNISIELHARTYDLPVYDPAWLAHFPDLTPAMLVSIVRLAVECERRYREGSLERPEAVEAIPWDQRDLDWVARSSGYLRPIIQLLGSL